MNATSDLLRPALRWAGVIAFPVVLFLTLRVGTRDPVGWPHLRYLLAVLVVILPASLLRIRPIPALALMLVGSMTVVTTFNSGESGYLADIRFLQFLVIDLAIGFIAAAQSRRISIIAALAVLGGQASAEMLVPLDAIGMTSRRVAFAFMLVTAWIIGDLIRQRRKQSEELRAQVAVQAVNAERLRIARELHDMVAHSIGIIAIQAAVGSRVIDSQPAEARNALDAIEVTGRETLSGLRRMLIALRDASPRPPLNPLPGLAEVDQLAATMADAGVQVNVQWAGRRRPLPPDIDLSAFRIVQEAVTNVARHARTDDCQVIIDYQEDALLLKIIDDGDGTIATAGYGIVGMRERVILLHGQFTAGPRTEGGFLVTARLPLPVGA